MHQLTAYCNGKIFTGTTILYQKVILVCNGIINGIIGENEILTNAEIIDLKHQLIAPAFIDLQINGGNHKLFSAELSTEALQATKEYSNKGGVDHFLITLFSNSTEVFIVC